ncbi:hypothetical protein ACHAPC_003796 [Botrytis cinerea]
MDGGLLCLCDICCTEDMSENSENSLSQSPDEGAKQTEEELDKTYGHSCASVLESEEDDERMNQNLDHEYEFLENNLRKIEKRKFGRISDDGDEVMEKKFEEMDKRNGEGFERYMMWLSRGGHGSDSSSDCEMDVDNNDVSGSESDRDENEYQDTGDGDWECSAEELEEAMCEDELLRSLYSDGGHMIECCI